MTPPDKPGTLDAGTVGDTSDLATAMPGDAGGTASLEKVRDILFGNQMRDVDRRFARLDERVAKEARDLKDDLRKRLDALDHYTRQEAESLADAVKREQGAREEGDARLAHELAEAVRALERRTAALDEQLSRNYREMRQQLLDQHQRLSDDIREKIDDVLAALAREAHELRSDKADRTALAALLKEMAMRLTDEFRLPGTEDA